MGKVKWYYWVAIGFTVTVIILLVYAKQRLKQRQIQFVQQVEKMIEMGKTFTAEDARAALTKVAQTYGIDTARELEKVARLETAHFTSRQYQLTGTGGMEVHGNAPYYGWYAPFFLKNPSYTPIGTTDLLEGAGLSVSGGTAQSKSPKVFVIMPSPEAWFMFLADYRQRYANEGGIARWYTTDAAKQALYRNSLAGIRTPFTDSMIV